MEYLNSSGLKEVPIELKIKTLKGKIQSDLKSLQLQGSRLKSREYAGQEEDLFILNQKRDYVEQLTKIEINDAEDYEYAKWLYNSGLYRKEEEIAQKIEELKKKAEQDRINEIKNSPEYQKHYHPFRVFLGWLFGIPYMLGCCTESGADMLDGLDNGDFLEAFATSFISMGVVLAYGFIPIIIAASIITYHYCKNYAYRFDVPVDEEVVEAIVGATVAGCTTYYIKSKSNKRKEAESQSTKI